MNLSRYIRRLGVEALGRYYGTYYGIVVDIEEEDPKKQNRLLLNIPEVRGSAPPIYAYPKGHYSGPGYGIQLLPKPGDQVLVSFRFGDPRRPFWQFAHPHKDSKPEEFADLKVFGLVTAGGTKVLMHEEDGTFSIETPAGTKVLLTEENINLTLKDSSQINIVEDNINLKTKGGTEIDIDDEHVKVKGEYSVYGETTKDALNELSSTLASASAVMGTTLLPLDPATITYLTVTFPAKLKEILTNH